MIKKVLFFIILLCYTISYANNDSIQNYVFNSSIGGDERFNYLNNYSMSLFRNNPDSAFYYFKMQVKLSKSLKNKRFEAIALSNVRYYYVRTGEYELAAEYQLQSLNLYLEIEDSSLLSNGYMDMATLFHDLKQFDNSVSYYKKALSYTSSKDSSIKASCYDNLGILYSNFKKFDTSMIYLYKSKNIRSHLKSSRKLAINYSNLGFLYANIASDSTVDWSVFKLSKKQLLDSSLFYHNKSFDIFNKYDSKYDMAYTYLGLGATYSLLNEDEKGIDYFKKCFEIGRQLDNLHIKVQVSEGLTLTYEKINNLDSSFVWLKRNMALNKEIFDGKSVIDIGKNISEIEYEIDLKQKKKIFELEIKEKEKELYILYFGIGSIILLFSVIFLLIKIRNKNRKQKLFYEGTLEGIESERKRIAMDLHDDINQNLAVIKSISDQNNEVEIKELTTDLIHKVKYISYNLYPTFLENIGLNKAIEILMLNYEKNIDLHMTYELDEGIEQMNQNEKLHTYRILQELTNNSIKYANATSLRITGEVKKGSYEFSYKDNGVGIKSKTKIGLGMKSIKERLNLINGDFKTIESNIGVHFRFTIKK